jgi:molybdate transport system substrate-binding protein
VNQAYGFSRGSIRIAGIIVLAGMILAAAPGCAGAAAIEPPVGEGNAGSELQGELTVFAAASLSQAFAQIAHAFEEAHPGVSVRVNFDGSQRLRTQLEHGARADVFAPADWEQMEAVAAAGLIEGQPANFATNRLVFLVNKGFAPITDGAAGAGSSPAISGATGQSRPAVTLKDLAKPGVKIVLAVPEAPVGRYSQTMLDRMGDSSFFGTDFGPEYRNRLLANVVSRETNVRSVTQKVALGEADAGITYHTDALEPYVAERVQVLTIPDSLNVTAHYPIAALREAALPAQAFIAFVQSAEAKTILEQYGFDPPSLPEAGSPQSASRLNLPASARPGQTRSAPTR